MTHWARKLLGEVTTVKKPIKALTDEELKREYSLWTAKIDTATEWGAKLTAAFEFQKECKRELALRNIFVD